MYLFCLFALIYLCIIFSLSADLIMLGKQSLHFLFVNRSFLFDHNHRNGWGRD